MMGDEEEVRVVKNPLLLVMERQEEKKKIRERRRMIRQERRRKAEARRAGGAANGSSSPDGSGASSPSSTPPTRRRGPGAKHGTKLPPSKLSSGVSFARVNADITAEMRVTGPKEPWEHSGNRPKSSSEEDSSSLSERDQQGSSSRRASATIDSLTRANGHGSPSKSSPSVSSSSGRVKTRLDGDGHGRATKGKNVVGDRLIKQVMTKIKEMEKEEYVNENELQDICQWLELLRLPLDYLGLLVEEGFDNMTTIKLLQDEDLRQMGIAKTGHRKKIMYWVQHNRPESYQEFAEGLDDDSLDTSSMASEPYWSSASADSFRISERD